MVENITEHLRKISVESCFELSAFRSGWETWKIEIQNKLGNNFNEIDILNLGDHLSTIFSITGTGRSQSDVSGGGYGWEGFICWYLNLCLIGSRGVAVRKISSLPEPLRDSISVNYGNFRSNTESDITVIIFPNLQEFTSDINTLEILDSRGMRIPNLLRSGKFNLKGIFDRLSELYFDNFELGIIQCKTNWNDNAQIPMLWSMIYEANSFVNSSISIGRNNYSLRDLRKFTYSFCTVPTNSLDNYTQSSTSVNRVRNLTGGNYWGYPTSNGIASSIKEIFNNNFRNAYTTNQRTCIRNSILELSERLNYFDII
ncbi:MAG: hypothetical protein EHM93_13305 [Bacteroidales bacterium]|nr:MAG: hypothetical protein EHM93_13305 [Bacteroidales bacterium]